MSVTFDVWCDILENPLEIMRGEVAQGVSEKAYGVEGSSQFHCCRVSQYEAISRTQLPRVGSSRGDHVRIKVNPSVVVSCLFKYEAKSSTTTSNVQDSLSKATLVQGVNPREFHEPGFVRGKVFRNTIMFPVVCNDIRLHNVTDCSCHHIIMPEFDFEPLAFGFQSVCTSLDPHTVEVTGTTTAQIPNVRTDAFSGNLHRTDPRLHP